MKYISYIFLRVLVLFIALIPFRVLYVFSDILSFILYRVAGYRKKVVRSNLISCFPDKSLKEIKAIERGFYRNLGDVTVEAMKGMSMSADDFRARHKALNPELQEHFYNRGQSIICVTAHYGNWEWGTNSAGVQISHQTIALYKALNNKYVDNYMRRLREKFNTKLVDIRDTHKVFSHYSDQKACFILAADQSPSSLKRAYWIDFLGRETACLHGPEKYAQIFNIPVLHTKIRRVSRGYYELSSSVLAENPRDLAEGEITRRYMKELEEHILAEPANWLWSHRRWKHQRIAKGEISLK